MNLLGYVAHSATEPRRSNSSGVPRPDDVVIEILYRGVCHTDVHQVRDVNATRMRYA
jgi:uncharacterized zinc-type alcohol dehydrogenase-like protein